MSDLAVPNSAQYATHQAYLERTELLHHKANNGDSNNSNSDSHMLETAASNTSLDADAGLKLLVAGPLYHSLSLSHFQHLPLAIVGVSLAGSIAFVDTASDAEALETLLQSKLSGALAAGASQPSVVRLGKGQFLVPGFVDTHIHAPQFVFTGTGYDLTLLQWLERYTFPREAAFAEARYAKASFARAVRRTLQCGTTSASYFGTIHLEASKTLADVVHAAGQRAFIGKVNMDRNAPDYYIESTADSIAATRKIVEYIQNDIASPLVTAVITPRFVPTCTAELMKGLGDLAAEFNLPIQSHLSETPSEVRWVAELHPTISTYSDVYDHYGLLTDRTIMAHAVHLSRHERDLLKTRGVGISHCASSNFCLHSGVLNLRRLMHEGHEKLGLGTDAAGGYSPSMFDAMRQAIIASKVIHIESRERAAGHALRAHQAETENGSLPTPDSANPEPPLKRIKTGMQNGTNSLEHEHEHAHQRDEIANDTTVYEPLTFSEAFYLATLGGAKVMGIDGTVGSFVPGKDFDALIVDVGVGGDDAVDQPSAPANVHVFAHDDPMSTFEKFVYLGDDRNICQVYVRGTCVSGQ
ncbi:hypothetical protein BC831DRAFT_465680 [Entophlyctis helioformis]|nr:hypothetical protein BC831DRAFT_465680 [Entophlyctis helioformis]